MKKVEIVIGSAFGDEGKGLTTDYLSARAGRNACVVRFNGGAQAGHTVETPDGKRHVFSHFCSGTMAGLPTYLSSFFVCNPIIFLRELKELSPFGVCPEVFVDRACPVTTPYDIMINQAVEKARGHAKHGSVGVGFGETLERHSHQEYALCVGDLTDTSALRSKLEHIRKKWINERLATFDVKNIEKQWSEHFLSDAILERFIEDVSEFLSHITLTSLDYLRARDHLIFEGAQGLLLDQKRGWFPHVTRSNTGVKNALDIAECLGISDCDVYYITRSYTTRHGEGPLPHALTHSPYQGIVDKTNKPNPYQGSLRFAWLDIDLFRDTVMRDMKEQQSSIALRPHLVMSCLDQIDDKAMYIADGVLRHTEPEMLAKLTARTIGAIDKLGSFGPTRNTIRHLANRNVSIVQRSNNRFKPVHILKDDNVTVKLDKPLLDKKGELLVDALA